MDDLWTRKAREIFGNPRPPATVTEDQFDGDQEDLVRYISIPWQQASHDDVGFFWAYNHDLTYVDLQEDLFRYAFPMCLARWRWTLSIRTDAGQGDSDFHRALTNGGALALLSESEGRAVQKYFIEGIEERLDDQKPNDHHFYTAWARTASLCYSVPILNEVWQMWCRLDTPGKCFALQQLYIEICNRPEAPSYIEEVLQPDSHIWTAVWLPENLITFQSAITGENMCRAVQIANERLGSDHLIQSLPAFAQPERAATFVEDKLRQIQRQYEEPLSKRQLTDLEQNYPQS